MKIIFTSFLNLVLMLSCAPLAYSVVGAPAKVGNSFEVANFKHGKEKWNPHAFEIHVDSTDSTDGSLTTRESAFRLPDGDKHIYERSLSPRSESSRSDISDITFDDSADGSANDSSSDDELESDAWMKLARDKRDKKVFQKAPKLEFEQGVKESMSDPDVTKTQDIQKMGREWLKSKMTLFNAIDSSIMSLIAELERISERPRCQLETSVYLIEGYKNVCEDAIAIYRDFLNGTSGDPINEDTLIEKTRELVVDMIFSIDHILSYIDEDDLKKYRILSAIKENIKNWKFKLKATSQISVAEGVKFRGREQR
jgi:hypothetical protein